MPNTVAGRQFSQEGGNYVQLFVEGALFGLVGTGTTASAKDHHHSAPPARTGETEGNSNSPEESGDHLLKDNCCRASPSFLV